MILFPVIHDKKKWHWRFLHPSYNKVQRDITAWQPSHKQKKSREAIRNNGGSLRRKKQDVRRYIEPANHLIPIKISVEFST